jgi:threonine aldolase
MLPPTGHDLAVDLLSDTVTLPSPAMRRAMVEAEVGDDVYGEDPTVRRLEAVAAERLGHQAALLVPSGTMGNLLALMTHCRRGERVLAGDRSDVWRWEAGGASVLGGLVLHPLATADDGRLEPAVVEAAVGDPDDPETAPAALLCLETPHCLTGGRVLSLAYLDEARELAHRHRLALHLDAARLFNAAVALGVEAGEIARRADSVIFCLSKGLAAPVGSVLAGPEPFVARARRLRKMVGGGMRQAGFLAAAGLHALDHMVERLAEDHATARRLAAALGQLPEVVLDPPEVETNMVFWRLGEPWTAAAFVAELARRGVRVGELGRGRVRAVTHYGIGDAEIDQAVAAVGEVLAAGPA